MTYREAMKTIKNPYNLNRVDAARAGFADAPIGENTTGFRIYIFDKEGHRYSPTSGKKTSTVEENVYYWHNKDTAQAYMAYLATALPQYTYGILPVEAIKGDRLEREFIYNEHTAYYGQYASMLHIKQDAPIQVLTPEMLKAAQANPDQELFSK